MSDPDARARHRTRRGRAAVIAAIALLALLPAGLAHGLASLPDYVSYVKDGGVWERLPFGQEAMPLVLPEQIPVGAGGLEPLAEIVAFRWAPDGTAMAMLARSTGGDSYREFIYDRQAKTVKAVGAAAVALPKAYSDGAPVDVSATEAKAPFGDATARLMRNGTPSVMQVFIEYPGKSPIIVSAPEVRDRDCSHLSYSPSGSYLAYEVRWSQSRTDVWVSTPDGRYSSQIATAAASPEFVPPYRPGTAGGGTETTGGASGSGGGFACPALGWLFGLTAIGAGAVGFIRGIVP
jgi:hypothetical protein